MIRRSGREVTREGCEFLCPEALPAAQPEDCAVGLGGYAPKDGAPAAGAVLRRLLSVVQEVLGSIRVVKAFARENYEVHRLEGESLETVEAALKARALKARLVPIVNLVTAAGICAVLYFGGNSALRNGLTAGSIVLFLSYIAKMYKPMQDISKIMDSYSRADVGYERIQEIIVIDDQVHDAPRARKAPAFKGRIDFEHVDFDYAPDRPVLFDVNLHIEAGSCVALVGPTGSGKTTIANMVARFYDPSAGTVKIDGIDVRSRAADQVYRGRQEAVADLRHESERPGVPEAAERQGFPRRGCAGDRADSRTGTFALHPDSSHASACARHFAGWTLGLCGKPEPAKTGAGSAAGDRHYFS
jgi:ABC-type multidrug transport system fused ATPase/permease subunit